MKECEACYVRELRCPALQKTDKKKKKKFSHFRGTGGDFSPYNCMKVLLMVQTSANAQHMQRGLQLVMACYTCSLDCLLTTAQRFAGKDRLKEPMQRCDHANMQIRED